MPSVEIEHVIDIPEDESCVIAPSIESPTFEAIPLLVITNLPLEFVLWVVGTKRFDEICIPQQPASTRLHFNAPPESSWIFDVRTETGTRRK